MHILKANLYILAFPAYKSYPKVNGKTNPKQHVNPDYRV